MDIVQLHEQAVDETVRLVDGVRPDQMNLPTPCSDWDVRTLINHMASGNVRFAVLLSRGERMSSQPNPGGLLGDDPAGAYRRSADEAKQAWADPALLDKRFDLPFGRLPGRAALGMRLIEMVTHGWDLGKATGQQPQFNPAAVQMASDLARSSLPEDRPADMPFAAPAPVAGDASDLDRFAAYLGRTP